MRAEVVLEAATQPIRVVNLSARRAEGVDGWAQTTVPCLVVLHAPKTEGNEDPWAPLMPKPANDPTTQPATGPTTQPAGEF